MGGLLGYAGSTFSSIGRVTGLLALGAIAVGGLEHLGIRLPLLQRDREAPQRWVHKGPVKWAILNGAALGMGWPTRIGFWAWYVVPASAFASSRPLAGATVYGAYALSRTLAAPALLSASRRVPQWDFSRDMLRLHRQAASLSAALLVVLGSATLGAARWISS